MKDNKSLFIFSFMILGIFIFLSCNANLIKDDINETSVDEQIPMVIEGKKLSDFKTNFGKAVFMTVNAAKDVYQVMSENGMIEDSSNVIVKGNANQKLIQFDELGKNFKDRLKNKLNSNRSQFCSLKSASNIKKNENEITIEHELNKISEEYRQSIYDLVPEYEDGSIVDFITISEGKIYIGGDVVCNVGSVESIALIETYNRVRNGEDLYQVVEEIQNDVNQLLMEYNNISTKAVFVNPALGSGVALSFSGCYATYEPWTDGKVYYQWDGMSDGQKEVVKKGMEIWQNGTENNIKFIQIEPNAWDWTCYALGQKNWVQMKSDEGVWGEALIGAGWGSYLKLNPNISDVNSDYYVGVACHELGHVLGLAHEFQRPDRDDYCIVDSTFTNGAKGFSKIANFDKMPSKAVVAGFKKVKVLFATLYIPYIWYYDYAKVYNSFDYDSIMQYDNLKLKFNNEVLNIIKRDKNESRRRIIVYFNSKEDKMLYNHLCSMKNINEIKNDSLLKNYDITLFLNRTCIPSSDDFGAVKKIN